jgi:hypothetical protein
LASQDESIGAVTRPDTAPPTILYSRRLAFARVAWVVLALLSAGLFVAALPQHLQRQQLVVVSGAPGPGELSPDDVRALADLGLSLQFYAAYDVLWSAVLAGVCAAIALFIFAYKSNDWMALLVSLALLNLGIIAPPAITALIAVHPLWRFPVALVQSLGLMALLALFYLFPDGQFVPRRMGWLIIGWVIYAFVRLFAPDPTYQIYVSRALTSDDMLTLAWYLGWLLAGLGAQLYRYRRVSTPAQRQQTKWVVFGFVAMCLGLVGVTVPLLSPALRRPGSERMLYELAVRPAATCALLLLPLSVGVALLRSRLFEVDILINRTLVYGLLTALLGLIYVGSVVLLQAIFRAFAGQGSSVAVVASTLAIVALFAPLRQRLQNAIDRRFYRRKYNAAQTLAAFSATLRDEVDLRTLSDRLLLVVVETMQPAHVSLWLRGSEQGAGVDGQPGAR